MSGTVKKLRDALAAASATAQAVMTAAEAESRELTDAEKVTVDAQLAEARALKARIGRAEENDSLQAELAALRAEGEKAAVQASTSALVPASAVGKTLGRQWVESTAFDYFRQGLHRAPAGWQSPAVELHAATLTEDPASGGKLLAPQQQAGILAATPPLIRVADLFAQGTDRRRVDLLSRREKLCERRGAGRRRRHQAGILAGSSTR